MSQGKQTKKCRQNFSIYIPPPARKTGNLSQQVTKTEEIKNQNVKVRSEENESVNKNTLPSTEAEISKNSPPLIENNKRNYKDLSKSRCSNEDSDNLSLNNLSITCGDGQKIRGKQSANPTLKDSDCVSNFSSVLKVNDTIKSICVKDRTLINDLPECSCTTTHQRTDGKPPPNKQSGGTLNPEEENQIFKNLWVQLCEQDNFESKTVKNHNTHKGNEVYGSREINENCIIEIYDFPVEFKTSDLREIFSSYITRGMKIRWVDDTHALGIYPSEIIAYEVLNTDLPNLKTRILNEGIPQSRDKAKLLLPPPPPPRPKTCSASARRLVSGALGIKAVFTPAEIEEEKQLLQVAREQRLLAKQRGLKGS